MAEQIERETPWAIIAPLDTSQGSVVLVDATAVPSFTTTLMELFRRPGQVGEGDATLSVRTGRRPQACQWRDSARAV